MSDVKGAEDPREHFNRVFHSSMKKYDEIVQIHNPNGLAARSGMFVGEMVALGGVGKVIRVAEGLSVFGMACEGGFIGGVMSEAHETNVVAGVAFGFIGGAGFSKLLLRGGGVSKPLLDRTLVRPEGFGEQVRAIEAFQQPALRSGFAVERLTERQIKAIKPTFEFSGTVAKHMGKKERAVPIHILQDIIKHPISVVKDPRGATNASMYYSRISRNGKPYNIEVLYDEKLNRISHFKYTEDSIGPLTKIERN